MSIPMWVILSMAVWAIALLAIREDFKGGGMMSGLVLFIAVPVAIAVTLALYICHLKGWFYL